MTGPRRTSALVAALVASTAMLLTELLHELGHLVALRVGGDGGARLGLLEVTVAPGGRVGAIAILAGPAATATIGTLAWLLRRPQARSRTTLRTSLMWLESLAICYLSVSLALAPLSSSDASRLLATVDAPPWVALALVPVGIGLLLLVGGAHQVLLAVQSSAPRATLLAGWGGVLLTQALLLRSFDWLFVVCMSLAAVAALVELRLTDAPRG